MRVLGFDYGTKYIGIAIGQNMTNTAIPLECLIVKNNQIDWTHIEQIIQLWQPKQLIVGLPLTMDQKKQNITFKSLSFINQLNQKFKLPLDQVDERLSTWEAKNHLALRYKSNLNSKEIKKINSYAAVVLVEQWLSENLRKK